MHQREIGDDVIVFFDSDMGGTLIIRGPVADTTAPAGVLRPVTSGEKAEAHVRFADLEHIAFHSTKEAVVLEGPDAARVYLTVAEVIEFVVAAYEQQIISLLEEGFVAPNREGLLMLARLKLDVQLMQHRAHATRQEGE